MFKGSRFFTCREFVYCDCSKITIKNIKNQKIARFNKVHLSVIKEIEHHIISLTELIEYCQKLCRKPEFPRENAQLPS